MTDFLEALRSGPVLLMDGAMGTELQRAGLTPGECYELWNVTHPEKVVAIHRSYLEAGACCLLTNTFQANPVALARFGLQDRLEEINHAAIQLARSAGEGHWVIASVGPMDVAKYPDQFDATIRSLVGVDALLLETWTEGFQLATTRALAWNVNPKNIPVLLSLTYAKPGLPGEKPLMPITGMTAAAAAGSAGTMGIAALGMNCGRDLGLEELLSIVGDYRSNTDLPLFARPNAGTPTQVDGKWIYSCGPAELTNGIEQLIESGVRMVGGCCGTTPDYIRAFAESGKLVGTGATGSDRTHIR